jgi:hypothetical protein
MDGRAFLDVARELAAGSSEAHRRSSAGRAYYALLHEALETLHRWGFSLPPRDKVHTFARLKLVYATDRDLKRIGLTLEALGRLRNAADYQLTPSGPFGSARSATQALTDAESAIALLDAIEADPTDVRLPWAQSPREPFTERELPRSAEPPCASRATCRLPRARTVQVGRSRDRPNPPQIPHIPLNCAHPLPSKPLHSECSPTDARKCTKWAR